MSLNVACSGEVGIGLEFGQTFIRDKKRLPFFLQTRISNNLLLLLHLLRRRPPSSRVPLPSHFE